MLWMFYRADSVWINMDKYVLSCTVYNVIMCNVTDVLSSGQCSMRSGQCSDKYVLMLWMFRRVDSVWINMFYFR